MGIIKRLKEQYPSGTRIKLVEMNDISAPPIGTLGTVNYVDDIGTIHVKWDNGSMLGVAYPEDKIIKIFKNLKPKMTLTLSHVVYPNKDFSVEENQNMFYEEAMKFWSETVLKEDNYSYNNYVLVEDKSNLSDNEQK